MVNIWLYPGQGTPRNILLSDPTVQRSAGGATNVALTGQQITASLGAVATVFDVSYGPTGQQIGASQGSIAVATGINTALTGQQIAASQGTLAVTISVSFVLTGQQIGSSQGATTVAYAVIYAPSGQQVGASQGGITVDTGATGTNVAITGQQVGANQGNPTANINIVVAITGQPIAASQGVISSAIGIQQGLTGQQVTASQGAISNVIALQVGLGGQQVGVQQGDPTVDTGATGDVSVPLTGQIVQFAQGVLQPTGYQVSPAPSPSGGGRVSKPKPVEKLEPRRVDVAVVLGGQTVSSLTGKIQPFIGPSPLYRRKMSLSGSRVGVTQGSMAVDIHYELQDDEDELLTILSLIGEIL